MMLRYLGWIEAADLVIKGVANTIANKQLTFDLARLREAIRAPRRGGAARKPVAEELEQLVPGAQLVGTRGFGEAVIRHMDDPA
jgi:isocitrate dehydrogenase